MEHFVRKERDRTLSLPFKGRFVNRNGDVSFCFPIRFEFVLLA